jgi:hypothetical protein
VEHDALQITERNLWRTVLRYPANEPLFGESIELVSESENKAVLSACTSSLCCNTEIALQHGGLIAREHDIGKCVLDAMSRDLSMAT